MTKSVEASQSAKSKAESLLRSGKGDAFVDFVSRESQRGLLTDLSLITRAALLLRSAERQVESLKLLERAVNLNPSSREAIENFARGLRDTGDLRSAVDSFLRASEMEESASTFNSIGVCFYELRQPKNAVEYYKRALHIDSNYAECWANLGNALKDVHKTHDAVKAFERSLALKPDYAWAMSCLSHILQRLTDHSKAVDLADRAVSCDMGNAEMWLTSLMVRLPLSPTNEEEGTYWVDQFADRLSKITTWAEQDENLKNLGERVGYSQPYYIAYRGGNHKSLLARYGALMCNAAQAFRGYEKRPSVKNQHTNKKIRIGIISAFIFRHSVWDIILKGFVLNINRDLFELHIFHTGSTEDEQTRIAKASVDTFVQGPHPHRRWIELASQANFDVILYPEVGMDPYSMHLACLRLAPLQITSWGHPMTSGLPTIDWFLSGELQEPNDCQNHYSEVVIKLPGTGVCTHKLEIEPKPVRFQPSDDRDISKYIKFYVCQHAFKFNDDAIDLLSNIISNIRQSMLVLVADNKYPEAFNIAFEKLKQKIAIKCQDGINRLYLLPWMTREQFLGSFSNVDVYLDLPGFSGYTTAWQAVSQGIPIVTLEGEFLRQRLAASVLRMVGENDGIASSVENYGEWCAEFANEYLNNKSSWTHRRSRIAASYKLLDGNTEPVRTFEKLLLSHFNKLKDPSEKDVVGLNTNVDSKAKSGTPTTLPITKPLFVVQQSDLNAILSRSELSSRRLFFYCPQLLDAAIVAGHHDNVLIQPKVHSRTQQVSLARIHATSLLVDTDCEAIRRKIFNSDSMSGWDAQLVSFFLTRLETVNNIASNLSLQRADLNGAMFLKSKDIQVFYFDGAASSRIFEHYFPNNYSGTHYAVGKQPISPYDYGWTLSAERRNTIAKNLVHIPTCFHHKELFSNWINETFTDSFEQLPSTYWNVPVRGSKTLLLDSIELLHEQNFLRIAKQYSEAAINVYVDRIDRHFGFEILEKSQKDYFKRQLESQAIQYLSLKKLGSISSLILSDHDVGYHGPLHSYASDCEARVVVLPHSEVTDSMKFVPASPNLVLIQDVNYRNFPKSITNSGLETKYASIRQSTKHFSASTRKRDRSVVLLLNSLNTNLSCYTNIKVLGNYFNELRKICIQHEFNLIVRLKPSGAPINVLSRLLDISSSNLLESAQKPLSELASQSCLSIAYGEPTSAITEFLMQQCYVLSVWDQSMPLSHWDELSLRPHFVQMLQPVQSTIIIDELLSKPNHLRTLTKAQQNSYLEDLRVNGSSKISRLSEVL